MKKLILIMVLFLAFVSISQAQYYPYKSTIKASDFPNSYIFSDGNGFYPISADSLKNQIRGYKVYTALLTQSFSSQTSGLLIVGHSYKIGEYKLGDDFTNVGASRNAAGVKFMATGTTPTGYDGGSTLIDLTSSAPVATVLENTIGNIVWSYIGIGVYYGTLSNAFTVNKTSLFVNNALNNISDGIEINGTKASVDYFIFSSLLGGSGMDGFLVDNQCCIEIRVYY